MNLKKCNKCGEIVKSIVSCSCDNCGIICCDEVMRDVKANSVECAVEKHIPNYEVVGDEIVASVNHVMTEEHFISFISLVVDNKEYIVYLKANDECKVRFPYIAGSKLYSYCNLHGLWEIDVK